MKHLRLSLVAKGSLPKVSIQNLRPSANLRICQLCVTKCMTIDWQIEIGICVFSHNYDIWFLLEILTAVNVASFDDICSSLQRDFRDTAIIPSKNNNQFRCGNNDIVSIKQHTSCILRTHFIFYKLICMAEDKVKICLTFWFLVFIIFGQPIFDAPIASFALFAD